MTESYQSCVIEFALGESIKSSKAGSEYDAKIARVAVLYEDLRLENLAASEPSIKRLDTSGQEFRQFYFIRRSIATVREFAEALRMLDEDPQFQLLKSGFDAKPRRGGQKASGSSSAGNLTCEISETTSEATFGYRPALFAINHLNDGAVTFEYEANPARNTGNVRFKFAGEIVAIVCAVMREPWRTQLIFV